MFGIEYVNECAISLTELISSDAGLFYDLYYVDKGGSHEHEENPASTENGA